MTTKEIFLLKALNKLKLLHFITSYARMLR